MSNFCELCNKTFASSRSLASHRYSFHRKNETVDEIMSDDNTTTTNNCQDENDQNQKMDSSSDIGNFI